MHEPKLIILDEPFTGFDPKNTEVIKNEILRLRDEGATIMLSTHRMENVEAICDEMVIINQSQVVANGTVDEIRQGQKDGSFELKYTGNLKLEALKGISTITNETGEQENRLIFTYANGTADLKAFTDQNINIKEYREIVPSMQDVFIKLTETHDE